MAASNVDPEVVDVFCTVLAHAAAHRLRSIRPLEKEKKSWYNVKQQTFSLKQKSYIHTQKFKITKKGLLNILKLIIVTHGKQ